MDRVGLFAPEVMEILEDPVIWDEFRSQFHAGKLHHSDRAEGHSIQVMDPQGLCRQIAQPKVLRVGFPVVKGVLLQITMIRRVGWREVTECVNPS